MYAKTLYGALIMFIESKVPRLKL